MTLSTKNNPTPSDDEEGDLADDPLLSAINDDLEQANKQTDNRLLVALGAVVVTLFLAEHYFGKNLWLEWCAAAATIAAIALTVYSAIHRKTDVAAKYGLICPACKHKPSPHMILSAARVRRCSKCGATLNG